MTFVANPIAAPKRTHMAMPDHLAELATRTAPVRPMTKVRPPVVDMKAIEEGNRIKKVAARIEVRDAVDDWKRKQEERRHQLWMLEQRRRAKLGMALLLIVRLDVARNIKVNHKANVGLIDAHTKRHRRHHNLDVITLEGFLDVSPFINL